MPSPQAVGVLVLRLWRDEGGHLRARITARLDVEDSEEFVSTAASPDEILEIVRAWIDDFIAVASGGAMSREGP